MLKAPDLIMYGDSEEDLSRYHRLLSRLVKSLDNLIGSD